MFRLLSILKRGTYALADKTFQTTTESVRLSGFVGSRENPQLLRT